MACDLVISSCLQSRHGQAASGIEWRMTATYAARFSHFDHVPMRAYGSTRSFDTNFQQPCLFCVCVVERL
jgi:hypothetical protein